MVDYNAVNDGMVSSPVFANGIIRRFAQDERVHFPLDASILEEEAYVDDVFIDG